MPSDSTPATVFFSGVGESHSSQYNSKACFRDRLNLFVQGVRRTTPLPAAVLDYGCGPGNISLVLGGLGYNVVGLDGASGMVNLGRERAAASGCSNVRFEHVDAASFDSSIGPFDVIVCSSVIEYVEDDVSLLKKLIASLRPGGHLLVSVPHRGNIFTPLEPIGHQIKLRMHGPRKGHLAVTCHRYKRKEFMQQLQGYGLKDIRCTSFECPVLGNIGIALSRMSFLSRMLFFEGRMS
ncbi:MAG TPA: class I SAM-dependent methyltransferase [Verrucomicrobiae bacterium]|jgi:2-polyprenyl-3-methyl-5-hydroxy-6-metoxy-1,4-benzoquinol methylase|nr:class I SAM-dependent methyltransferase [Verrucomicrobiae bacterium]